jgi:pantoate--beta-alanine ligase
MSSRNGYLDAASRAQAPALHSALQQAADAIRSGRRDFAALEAAGAAQLMAVGMRADYFAVRRAADLGLPAATTAQLVVLAAAYCGPARLIDNVLVDC